MLQHLLNLQDFAYFILFLEMRHAFSIVPLPFHWTRNLIEGPSRLFVMHVHKLWGKVGHLIARARLLSKLFGFMSSTPSFPFSLRERFQRKIRFFFPVLKMVVERTVHFYIYSFFSPFTPGKNRYDVIIFLF